MKTSNISREAVWYNYIFNVSRLYLSVPAFFYSLMLNVCDFNTEEIFLLKPNRWGGGGGKLRILF